MSALFLRDIKGKEKGPKVVEEWKIGKIRKVEEGEMATGKGRGSDQAKDRGLSRHNAL